MPKREVLSSKNTLYWVLVSAVLYLVGCDPDPVEPLPQPEYGVFEFNVRGYVNGAPLQIDQTYTNPEGQRMQIELCKMYISDVVLIQEDGSELPVRETHLFDFETATYGKTQHGDGVYFLADVPKGKYRGIRFGVGVPPSRNNSDPSQYPEDHPLSIYQGTHWDWNTGYRYVMLDGRMDTLGTQPPTLDHPFAYHLGQNELYRTYELLDEEYAFEIRDGYETRFVLETDVVEWFRNREHDEVIDMKTQHMTHSMGNGLPLARKINENLHQSFFFYTETEAL